MGSKVTANIDIASWIRRLRAHTGLTQEKFAAKLGVTFPTINRWENQRSSPSPLALRQLENLAREVGLEASDPSFALGTDALN
jgi:putative transcriptional regulator